MNKKNIAKKLSYVKRTEAIHNKMVKFLQSKRGMKMLEQYGRTPLPLLLKLFHAPSMGQLELPRQYGVIRTAIEKAGKLPIVEYNIRDYTHINDDVRKEKNKMLASKEAKYDASRAKFVKNYQKNKCSVFLPPYVQKMLNKRDEWEIKRDKTGKPVIATDIVNGELRLLFDKLSGLPIYKFKRKSNKVGLALKLHMLEEHKMNKYDRKHPIPTMEELNSAKERDLFPGMLIEAHKQLREAHLEQIRKDLSDLYCPVPIHVMVKDKDDNVKKLESFANIRLGRTRSDTLDCRNKIRGDLKERLDNVMNIAIRENPNGRITCMHLTSHNPTRQVVVMPHMLAAA